MSKKTRIADGIYRDEKTGILHIRIKDERGRDKWKSTKGKAMGTAKAMRDKMREERRLRGLDLKKSAREEEKQEMTLSDLIERYRPKFESKKSARDEKRFAKYWKRVLGRERIHDILPYDIDEARLDKLHTGVRPATVNRYTGFLRSIFYLAERDYLVDSNPCSGRRVPPFPETGIRDRVIYPHEETAILQNLSPLSRAAFLISLYAGLRMGEVIRLKRADVDLTRGRFLLEETKAGKRQVADISPVAREAALYAMGAHKADHLFPSPADKTTHISRRSLHDRLIKALIAAGIEVKPASQGGVTWHATRHTFITRLTENGSNIGTVKELARHSTITMTNDYMHVGREMNQTALEALCAGVNVTELFPAAQSKGGHLRQVSG
jgi:integrase